MMKSSGRSSLCKHSEHAHALCLWRLSINWQIYASRIGMRIGSPGVFEKMSGTPLLALVADNQPENSTQAALAAQMAATHWMIMRLSAQALNRGYSVNGGGAALASKLSRTFAMQCETMQALKGKTRTAKQSIHVTKETHQHVHYHDERGGQDRNGNQSHGRGGTEAPDVNEAMWSDDEGGDTLPSASRKRLGPVPLPRCESGSAEG